MATLDGKVNGRKNLKRFKSIGGGTELTIKVQGQFETPVKVEGEMVKLTFFFK